MKKISLCFEKLAIRIYLYVHIFKHIYISIYVYTYVIINVNIYIHIGNHNSTDSNEEKYDYVLKCWLPCGTLRPSNPSTPKTKTYSSFEKVNIHMNIYVYIHMYIYIDIYPQPTHEEELYYIREGIYSHLCMYISEYKYMMIHIYVQYVYIYISLYTLSRIRVILHSGRYIYSHSCMKCMKKHQHM
jgi:hypothetical protein